MDRIILLGAGGHCKTIIDSIKDSYDIIGILDNFKAGSILGVDIIGKDEKLKEIFDTGVKYAFVSFLGIMKGYQRENIYYLLKNIGYELPNIIDKTSIVSQDVYLEDGIYVGKGAIINSSASIGRMSTINTAAVVEHDCIIGHYVHVAPKALLCGGVSVSNYSHIGANATVIHRVNIGEKCLIGAGALIVKDIQSNSKVYGNIGRMKSIE